MRRDQAQRTTRVGILRPLLTRVAAQAGDLTSADEGEVVAVAEAVDGAIEGHDNVGRVVLYHKRPILGVL